MLLRVIDLNGSVAGQEPLRRRIDAGAAARIDAADLAPSLRILASRAAMDLVVHPQLEVLTRISVDDLHIRPPAKAYWPPPCQRYEPAPP